MVSSAMGATAEEEAPYRACTQCTRLCQTTHRDRLPRFVPKFSRSIPEYTLPSEKNCYLQIPAPYCQDHIPIGSKREYILSLIAWRREIRSRSPSLRQIGFFDKLGTEKYPVDSRGSSSTVVEKAPQRGPPNETVGSNFTSSADGTPQRTPTQELKPKFCTCPPSGKASGQTGNRDEKLSRLSRKRALNGKDRLPHEPVETDEEQPSSSSRSSAALEDLVLLLARKVLSKSKQKSGRRDGKDWRGTQLVVTSKR